MKKYIIWFVLLTACDLFVQKPNNNIQPNIDTDKVQVKTIDDNDKVVEEITILPYEGKYSLKNRFWDIEKIKDIKKDVEGMLADKIGFLQNDSLFLEIEYVDWKPEYEQKQFIIVSQAVSGKQIWRVTYVSEHIQNGSIPLNVIYRTSIADVLLQDAVKEEYDLVPDALWKSILYYGCELEEYLFEQMILRIVNANDIPLEQAVVGIDSNKPLLPELENLFLLMFLKEKYGENDGVKDFAYNVLFNHKNWEEQIAVSSGEDFSTFAQKVTNFARTYLVSRYRNLIVKYNEALKEYLSDRYGSAIAKGQTFTLNYHESLLNLDMHFWMAMCYYELKNYDLCLEQLQNIFANKRYFCHHLALANYREAMALFRSQKLPLAIEAFAKFRRDFPWEKDFVGSSLYFQAKSFMANNQRERAIYYFEEFIRDHKNHHRHVDVVEKMAYLHLQRERYQRAKVLFTKILQLDAEEKVKVLARQSIQKISTLEEQELSVSLKRELQQMTKDFATLSKSRKREVLQEMSYIGSVTLPRLSGLYLDSTDVMPSFINSVANMQSLKGISLLLQILRTQRDYDQNVFVALAQIGVPTAELEMILEEEFQDISEERRLEITQSFRELLWDGNDIVLQEIPNFVEQINGDAQQQNKIIEKMNLSLGNEQIPVLKKLVLHGKSEKVKIHALENLIVWQEEGSADFLNELLFHSQPEIRLLALQGLKKQQYYRINKFEQLFTDSYVKVREEALNLLPFVDILGKIDILVSLLNDKNYDIRNRARQNLIDAKDAKANLALAKGLGKDTSNISYYNYIVQILRVRTNDFELLQSYHPKMSPEQRKELAEQLVTKWKYPR